MRATFGSQVHTLSATPLLNSDQKKHLLSAHRAQAFARRARKGRGRTFSSYLGAAHRVLALTSDRENIPCDVGRAVLGAQRRDVETSHKTVTPE